MDVSHRSINTASNELPFGTLASPLLLTTSIRTQLQFSMSSQSQNSETSFGVIPLPSDSSHSAIQLNGAKRERAFEELDTLRDCK